VMLDWCDLLYLSHAKFLQQLPKQLSNESIVLASFLCWQGEDSLSNDRLREVALELINI
jgi:hypothetical protein